MSFILHSNFFDITISILTILNSILILILSINDLKKDLIDLIENKNVLVAEKNNNILGFIIFEIKDKRSKTLWIDQLVVDKKERGKGISSLLIKKAEEIAKKEKCVRVEFCCWSFNKHANEIYNHLGFKEQRVIFEKEI